MGAGLVTTTALAGRGLVRSVRTVAHGQYGEAGLQALAALATPAVLAPSAAASCSWMCSTPLASCPDQPWTACNQRCPLTRPRQG
ncbi:MAG TPA: hypothetical protein VH682_16265 [Gemmataceae bacterium]